MCGSGRTAILALAALMAGCSSGDDVDVAPATPDEQKALAEAKAMIPESELPSPTPTANSAATESANR